MRTRLLLLLLITALLSSSVHSQLKEASKNPTANPDFSKEAFVIDEMVTRIVAEADGTFLRTQSTAIHILSDAGIKSFAVISFPYTSANQTVTFDYVRVRKPDGTVVNTPDYNIQDMPADVTRVAPMYSDIHEKHIAVKGLGVGDTLEYLVRTQVTKPEIPNQFWVDYAFNNETIIKNERLEISLPRTTRVTVNSPDVKPEITEQGERRIYRWTSSNLQRKESKPGARKLKKDKDPPSVTVTTFSNWEEIGRWYAQLQQDQIKVTPAIQVKAAQLTKGLSTDDEKLHAIYDFVAMRIHYVGLSFGIGRYQPHSADDVLSNEYGDCKDKHTLLASLLKATGFDAWPVLVNSSRKLKTDAPSPSQFDHVITAIPRGDKIIWLDTTPEVAPFGLILPNLRDKDVLVIPSSKPPYVVKTPADPPFGAQQIFSAEGKLSREGTFTAKMEQSYRGDSEVVMRSAFRQVPQAEWKELTQRISYGAGYAGEVSAVTTSPVDDTSKPFHLSYDYLRKKYGQWENHRITPPLPPIGIESNDTEEEAPEEPLFLGAPGELVYRSKVELPAGCSLKLPKNLDLVRPYAEYHTAHTFENGTFSTVRRFVIKNREVPLADWSDFLKFRKQIYDDEGQFISIEGLSNTSPAITADSKDADSDEEDNVDVSALFNEGYNAMQKRDLARAYEAFQKVVEKNPKFPGAHFNLAIIAAMRGDSLQALEQFRKEEEISPEDSRTYMTAADLLTFMNHTDEAIEQYRKLLKIEPGNIDATLRLAYLLTNQKKYADSVAVLEKAIEASPDSRNLHLALASAYMKAGQKDKAVAEYRESLEGKYAPKEFNPMAFNDAAYWLADNDVELPLAKHYAEKALVELETRSNAHPDDNDIILSDTRQLEALWDTTGWVYFKLGDLARAESYVRAAWLMSQKAVIGDHLGQIYERQGKKSAALHAYELAMAVQPRLSPAGAKDFQDQLNTLHTHYERLGGKPKPLEIKRLPNGEWTPTPQEELSRMRKTRVPIPTAPAASGEVLIVLSPAKIVAVRFVSGDESLKAMLPKFEKATYNLSFPTGSNASIGARASVVCTKGSGCDVVLHTTADTMPGLPIIGN